MSHSVKLFALKDAHALIDRLLLVQKLSAKAYREQMAGTSKTPETVIVQQLVAQLAGSEKVIVHPLGAQLTWKQRLAVLDKLESPPGRLWYAAEAVEHGWSRNIPVRCGQGGHRNCATAGCTNVPTQVRNCASSPCTNRSAGGGNCAAACCTDSVLLPVSDALPVKYGIRLVGPLTDDLVRRRRKGLGVSSLKNCRQSHLMYPQIRQTPIGELPRDPTGSDHGFGSGKSNLRRVSKRIRQTLSAELGVGSRYQTPLSTAERLRPFLDGKSHFEQTVGQTSWSAGFLGPPAPHGVGDLPHTWQNENCCFPEADAACSEALRHRSPSKFTPTPKKAAAWPARKK